MNIISSIPLTEGLVALLLADSRSAAAITAVVGVVADLGGCGAAVVLGFSLPGLDAILAHRQRPIDPVQFVVEAACVADGLSIVVPAPEGGGRRAAVGTAEADAPRRRLEHRALQKSNWLFKK